MRAATRRVADQREDAHAQALDDASRPDDAHAMVAPAVNPHTEDLETAAPVVHSDATDYRLPFGSVEEIFAAVENKGTDRAGDTLKNLRYMLPTGLEVILGKSPWDEWGRGKMESGVHEQAS